MKALLRHSRLSTPNCLNSSQMKINQQMFLCWKKVQAHPRRKVLNALASSIAGSRNHGPRSFRGDLWPIADRRVPSNDPRNSCVTHFGSSFLLVFPFRAKFSGIYWKHVAFHIRTVAGGPTLRPRRCLILRPWHTMISVNRPAGLLFYSFVAAQIEGSRQNAT